MSLAQLTPTSKALCGVRLDNSVSIHHLLPVYDYPTTCFNDVVLVPLASWLFYVALAVVAIVVVLNRSKSRRQTAADSKLRRYRYTGSKYAALKTIGSIIYTLLIIAAILMNILEEVRLSIFKPNSRGVGLLPFIYPSILLVLILSHIPLKSHFTQLAIRCAILLFWVLSLIFTAVKLRGLVLVGQVEPRDGTEYLSSDQQLDVGVIVGLYGIFVIVESIALVKAFRRRDVRKVEEV
ncbi:unnamed protein product [Sympodiomycopsis kandeliae]